MSTENKKLFLLDAFALIYRAHFAFIKNPRINSKGQNTSAVFGFTNALLEVLRKEQPTHLGVVFDAPTQTAREAIFPEYKANRDEMPEDIRNSIPLIYKLLEAMNIPAYSSDGYEADDVIGTLAKKAEQNGFATYMMTPDKDFGQLVSENIFMYRPGRSGKPAEVWGIPEVCEQFQISRPTQVIDILGLWGDAVDNIPGVPGIGEKTAKKLVGLYDSVEGLLANTDQLKGKQKENVINFADQALLSKQLATILLDAPVDFKPDELEITVPNKEALIDLFSELEFRNMAKRVLGEDVQLKQVAPVSGQMDLFADSGIEQNDAITEERKSIETVPHSYQLIATKEERQKLIHKLENCSAFCFDTETTGTNALQAEIVGLAISFKAHEAYYIPTTNDRNVATEILAEFKSVFASDKIEKIAHNIKYDLAILSHYGLRVEDPVFDTMIAHYLLQPDMKHGMDILAETYLNYQPVSIETIIGKKGKNQRNMADLSPEAIVDYAAEDADITFQLWKHFRPKFEEAPFKSILFDVELPLCRVLTRMEAEGIRLDVGALEKFSQELQTDLVDLHDKIHELAGVEFNIDSPKQLGNVLFDNLKIDEKAKKTKTGQYQTSEETLVKLEGKHEIIPHILSYRSVKKLKSTYVDALPTMVDSSTGNVHTSYMQTVAATGRLSSNNPNLQNIPIRTTRGQEIRKTFIPRNSDFTLLAADYSQIELRIMAALSKEKAMQEAFVNGIDIHSTTASKVFNVSLDEVTRDMRSKAKMVNFGIIYGISAFGLSQRLSIPRKEAKAIIDNYFEKYPEIKGFMDSSIQFAKDNGYVETILGRRRILKDIHSNNAVVRGFAERNAINAPIQGSAADIIKIAMINIDQKMFEQETKSKMLLQVHDELVFDVHKDEMDYMATMVKEEMEQAVQLSVPLTVEYGTGNNWLEAH